MKNHGDLSRRLKPFLLALSCSCVAGYKSQRLLAPAFFRCDIIVKPTPWWSAFRERFNLYASGRGGVGNLQVLLKNATSIVQNLGPEYEKLSDIIYNVLYFFVNGLQPADDAPCFYGIFVAYYLLHHLERRRLRNPDDELKVASTAISMIAGLYFARESGWQIPSYIALDSSLRNFDTASDFLPNFKNSLTFSRPAHKVLRSAGQVLFKVIVIGSHTSQVVQSGRMLENITRSYHLPAKINLAGACYPRDAFIEVGGNPDSRLSKALLLGPSGLDEVSAALIDAGIPTFDIAVAFGPGIPLLIRKLSQDIRILAMYGVYPWRACAPKEVSEELIVGQRHAKTFLLATSAITALHLLYIAGIKVSVVTPLPDNLPMYSPEKRKRLLQWRGDVLWNTMAGHTYTDWILTLLTENALPWEMQSMTHGLTVNGIGMDWPQIVQYSAVMFVPEDLTKIAFWDLYSTATPLFVADADIVAQLICGKPISRGKMHFFDPFIKQATALPYYGTGKFERLQPFDLDGWCPQKLGLWMPYADYYTFPSVTTFSSGIDLLSKLTAANLRSISRAMRAEIHRKLRQARLDFTFALAHLI